MGILVEWADPTPANTCEMCLPFVGFVFDSDDALPLPAHPRCQCYYSPVLGNERVTNWNWDEMPAVTRQRWIAYTAWRLRENLPISNLLLPLIPEAETYNEKENREENNNMPPETNHYRHLMYGPIHGRVDKESHVIHGVSLMQPVEALGHDFLIDAKSISQLIALTNALPNGAKARFTHPGLSNDGLGKLLGRVRNARLHNGSAIGDLHLSPVAAKSPHGDLRSYVEALAEDDPGAFGMSAVIWLDYVWVLDNGDEILADNTPTPENATTEIPVARLTSVDAIDAVDEPAANRDGLFSAAFNKTTNTLAEEIFQQLDSLLSTFDITPEQLPQLASDIFSSGDILPEIRTAISQLADDYAMPPEKARTFAHQYALARQHVIPTVENGRVVALTKPTSNRVPLSRPTNGRNQSEVIMPDKPKEQAKAPPPPTTPTPAAAPQPLETQKWLDSIQNQAVTAALDASGLPLLTRQRLASQNYDSPEQLNDAILEAKTELAAVVSDETIQIGDRSTSGLIDSINAGLDTVTNAATWLFGDPDATLPPPSLRNSAEIYRLLTGDIYWRGIFDKATALASANPTTLPGLAVDAMNKVIIAKWDTLGVYRWFEQIVIVQPNNGTLHDMNWLQYGGLSNLSTVDDGGAYTEKSVGDSKETDSFIKYGNYVGITRKMLRNSEIAQIQAIPNALAVAAIRTRSAKIAAIFTANSGVGPTLDQDSVALFHTASHANLLQTAYSISAWKAARLECFKQTELTSGLRQGLWPKFWIGPADLYDQALIDFGYGAGPGGFTGTGDNDVNPYAISRPGDPRPTPIAVPEFTDANDWAYLADPAIAPIIQMSYSQNPGGNIHPLPELFSVVNEQTGLMFTNDTMPIKIRDEYAYGVATYRGIGKRNVA